jgi:hypothetical protein
MGVMSDRFAMVAQCPLLTQQRPNRCAALSDATGQHRKRATSLGYLIGVTGSRD